MEKTAFVKDESEIVFVVDDKLVVAIYVKTLFFRISILRICKL